VLTGDPSGGVPLASVRAVRRWTSPLVSLALVGAFAGVASADTATSTSTTTSTTTTLPGPVAPLTGRPDPQRIAKHRCAVTVKIDNTYLAHPQWGLDQADIVYEEIVEGGITRLAAIFNSSAPGRVGPVRSVRRTDREIVTSLGGIFAFSGGAAYAINSIRLAPVKLYGQANSGPMMFRDARRPAPHNLFVNVHALVRVGGRPTPPRPQFTYSNQPFAYAGPTVRRVVVGFANGYATTWGWNARTKSWDRSIFGAPDRAADRRRISPANVVILKVHYRGGVGVEGSEAVLSGSGPMTVLSRHHLTNGRWSRSSLSRPLTLRTVGGRVIPLAPGQTWVELLDVSEHLTITR
jgi:hypothetical protein